MRSPKFKMPRLRPGRKRPAPTGEFVPRRPLAVLFNRRTLLALSHAPKAIFSRETLRWLVRFKPRFLVLEKYVFQEVMTSFFVGLAGFTLFMVATGIFIMGEKIFSKHIPFFTTIRVLLLNSPAYLVLAIPVAVLFATLMGMGRLVKDNEITGLTTNGVSLYRILLPFLTLALYCTLATFLVYQYTVPHDNKESARILSVFWDSQIVDYLKPQIIIKAPDDRYIYIDQVDRDSGMMYGIKVYDFSENRPIPRIFYARQGYVQNKFLILDDVRVYETDAHDGNVVASAISANTRIDISRRLKGFGYQPTPMEMSSKELMQAIKELSAEMSTSARAALDRKREFLTDYTEYYFKFSLPFAAVVLVLVAVPLSLRGPRDERNLGVIMSFILVMFYYLLYFSARIEGANGWLPPGIAAWSQNIVFVAAAGFLFWKARK
jgi:lipopolysaccharide export LptBFGC system permease protein LptF